MSNTPVVPTPHGGPETYLGKVHDIQFNRDCVHVACFQVEIEEVWNVSNACMLKINNEGKAVPTENREQALGILDPFILDPSILKSALINIKQGNAYQLNTEESLKDAAGNLYTGN